MADGVSAAQQALVASLFDMATCGVSPCTSVLSMAGIPLAARKPLLMLLQHAQPAMAGRGCGLAAEGAACRLGASAARKQSLGCASS